MTDDLHVVHLLAPVAFGGGEALLCDLIACRQPGIRESMVTVGRAPLLEARLDAQATPWRATGQSPVGSERRGKAGELLGALPRVLEIRRIMAELQPDVIHAHGFPPSFLAAGLPRSGGALAYTHHYERSTPGPLERWALTRVFDRFDALSTPADHLSAAMNRAFPGVRHRFETTRVGVSDACFDARPDPSWRRDVAPGVAVGICVGRFIPSKNQRLILDTVEAMPPVERARLVIWLVGDGPERATLESRVRTIGVERQIRFLGHVEHAEMPGLLATADFALFPTLTEGSSIAGAEALAAGLPGVSLAIPPMIETLGDAGIACQASEFRTGLAAMLDRFPELRAVARARGEQARISSVKPQWAALHRRIAAQSRVRSSSSTA